MMLHQWELPERMEMRFGAFNAEPIADSISQVAHFPSLYPKYTSRKTTSPKTTLAGALHEVGHLVIHPEISKISPTWRYATKRGMTIEKEYSTASQVFYQLEKENIWFMPNQNPENFRVDRRESYAVLQAAFEKKQSLWEEMLRIRGFYNFGSLSYQEIFSDLFAVVYLEDLQAIAKLLSDGTRSSQYRGFASRMSARERNQWLATLQSELRAKNSIQHIVFSPARGEIGNLIQSQIKTTTGKRRAMRSLLNAIASESDRLGIEYFRLPWKIDFQKLNDDLVDAFKTEWDRPAE